MKNEEYAKKILNTKKEGSSHGNNNSLNNINNTKSNKKQIFLKNKEKL